MTQYYPLTGLQFGTDPFLFVLELIALLNLGASHVRRNTHLFSCLFILEG